MRRQSDIADRPRTGQGRRARDRLLGGEIPAPPRGAGGRERAELENLLLFASDDLRESALAVGGIEAFLVRARHLLDNVDDSADEIAELLQTDLEERVQALDDALSALRRSMNALQQRV